MRRETEMTLSAEQIAVLVQDEALAVQPCGCPACSHQVQEGHFACDSASDMMLEAERTGIVVRAYDDGAWRWFCV